MQLSGFDSDIFWKNALNIGDNTAFCDLALQLFHYQAEQVETYRQFLEHLGLNHADVNSLNDIPHLPVSAFRTHSVYDTGDQPKTQFRSSGTTGHVSSIHYVRDTGIYFTSFSEGFRRIFGEPEKYCLAALLPSYIERGNSSLVYMADRLIKATGNPRSGFYLGDTNSLISLLVSCQEEKQPLILLGVSFALLDLFETNPVHIPDTVIIETGGMKGRRKELTRDELHEILKWQTGVKKIYSEYGMTEMLSQAWSISGGRFICPPWLKVQSHEVNDPFCQAHAGETGILRIMDLANIHSCAFLETQDLGRVFEDGTFEVLGRMDNSEWRGCNLMISGI